MSRGTTLLGLAVTALALATLGCALPLPAAQLTATAESRPPPAPEARGGAGAVQAASAGQLSLSSDDGDGAEEPEAAEATPEPTTSATPAPVSAAATPEPALQPANFPSDTIEALNTVRNQQGRASLTYDAALSAAAGAYAQYMAQGNFFGHFGPDGSSPTSRIRAAGFGGQYKGEALSAGQGSPAAALQALLASAQHAAILLEGSSAAVGVGYYYAPASFYQHYWVVLTGNP